MSDTNESFNDSKHTSFTADAVSDGQLHSSYSFGAFVELPPEMKLHVLSFLSPRGITITLTQLIVSTS